MKTVKVISTVFITMVIFVLCGSALGEPVFCAVGWFGEFAHIDPDIGIVTPIRNDLPSGLQALAWSPDGILYAGRENDIYKIDPRTGNYEHYLSITVDIRGMAISPSGVLYVTSEHTSSQAFGAINLETGAYTDIGLLWGGLTKAQGMAFSPNGVLYGIHPSRPSFKLFTIDLDDAETHLITDSLSTVGVNQSLSFTHEGSLYAIGEEIFAQIDPADGSVIGEPITLSGCGECEFRGLALISNSYYDYYVNAEGTGDYPTIQAAIDVANGGEIIVVADGVYTGEGNRDIDFKGLAITVRSENGPEHCIIDCQGSEDDPHRGFYFHRGEDGNSVVDGFTITNGTEGRGGGISCEQSSPTLINCRIIGNTASAYWGLGGGIMLVRGAKPTITNCTISGNSSPFQGGGIYTADFAYPIISNCIISENLVTGDRADCGGGIIVGLYGSLRLSNCIISGNSSDKHAGGILISGRKGHCNITNCTITGNSAAFEGGGVLCGASELVLTNCILWDNDALLGAQIRIEGSSVFPDRSALLTISYSDTQDGRDGISVGSNSTLVWSEGNIDIDPLFVNPISGDYHLLPSSLCINAGDPNYIPEPNETDYDGKSRIIHGRIDMGAYESNYNNIPVAIAGPNQTEYAWIDGWVEVVLDGSASFDTDGNELTYLWSWTVDGNTYDINGVDPVIELPVGEYVINLTVNDGTGDSEPDQVVITVIEAMESHVLIFPRVIVRHSRQKNILAWIRLPEGIDKEQISDEPILLWPGEIEAVNQYVIEHGRRGHKRTSVLAFFKKAELMDAVVDNGEVEVEAIGSLRSGRYFYGSDTVLIKGRPNRPSRRWRFN